MFNLGDAETWDSPVEDEPDLYLVLFWKGEEILRTRVFRDVDFMSVDPVSREELWLTRDLGEFRL